MTTNPARQPAGIRVGGQYANRTFRASETVELGAAPALVVEEYDEHPPLEHLVQRIRDSGLAGNLKEISFSEDTMHSELVRDGVELAISTSDRTIQISRNDDWDLDHRGESELTSLKFQGSLAPEDIAASVNQSFRQAAVAGAWAKGNLRQGDGFTFGLPVVNGSEVYQELATPHGDFSVRVAGEGEPLAVLNNDGTQLSPRMSSAFLADAAEAGGGNPEDLELSLKLCADAARNHDETYG